MTEISNIDVTDAGARIEGRDLSAWIAEIRELLRLALPLVVTQLAQMAIMTTDVVMLGRLSEQALAGAALGNTVFFFAWLIGLGPTAAISPMIAHILGARPNDRAGVRAVTRMGFWAVLLLSLPLAILLLFTRDILLALAQQPALADAAGRFVAPLCLGMPFSLGFQVLRNYATALGKPNTSLLVMVLTIVFNAFGDYALIFGHFGMPRLGLFGSGVSSAWSYAFSCIAMTAVVFAAPVLRKYRIFRRFARPDWSKFVELFRLGMPIGLTMIFEAMLFNAATLLMGIFGTESVAAHQIAINVASITFMVPLGIALAATVRVGLSAGGGDRQGVRRSGTAAILVSATFMCLSGAMIALFPYQIARLYFSADTGAVALTVVFLRVAAAFQIFDGIQVTAALTLRGLKDAHMPMWIAGACYWLAGFPVCIGLSIGLGLKGLGVWIGLAFALFMAALCMCWRFYHLSREQ
ncbi:MAG: MATE family efflux transporter [Alphaproteobacteria bacterium]|nr:MATE family efflux transporter [Alphaproteobacteria bacterium]MDE2112303.1 MATE family efflux transporter [Alphaproteobacteria bacterium]